MSPLGATSTYTYASTYTNNESKVKTNNHWTRTTVDGLGRVIKTEVGTGTSTVVSTVDTEYAACACSPIGKVKRVSQPYAPGGTIYWTAYTFDSLGRTTRVDLPDGSGATTYAYSGPTVTITSPSGKWKAYRTNALGELIQVTEPAPEGGTHETYYAYNILGQLTTVTMPRGSTTQTRTFAYDLTTGRLTSATNPENGTVSYTYNADGTVATKTDAKGQRTEYTYNSSTGRLTQVRRYTPSVSGGYYERTCERVDYYYTTNPFDSTYSQNAHGRLAAVQWGDASCVTGQWRENYTYTPAGLLVGKKILKYNNGWFNAHELEGSFTYDNEGRPKSVTYPKAYRHAQIPGTTTVTTALWTGDYYSITRNDFGQPITMKHRRPYVTGQPDYTLYEEVKNITYGAGGQLTSWQAAMRSYPDYAETWFTETRSYNALNQLTRITGPVNVEYRYSATQNDGRITQMKDYTTGEEITYQYDSLNRLISAVTTGTEWGLSFQYDGFGNLTNQVVTQGTAPSLAVAVDPATNRISGSGFSYDANGNITAGLGIAMTYDVANRMTRAGTDDYAYDPSNRKVWSRSASGQERMYFYGAQGELLGTYRLDIQFPPYYEETRAYLDGRLVLINAPSGSLGITQIPASMDRLGSQRKYANIRYGYAEFTDTSYFPYGETRTGTGPMFATYPKDSTTGLNYAMNRWYSSQIARFTTPDPYIASSSTTDPQSWNRYAYVQNDPVNFIDPRGLQRAAPFCYWRNDIRHDAEGWFFTGFQEFVCENWGGGGGGGVVPPPPPDVDGIDLALEGLRQISTGSFRKKGPCRDFFLALAGGNKLGGIQLMNSAAMVARNGSRSETVYDGESSQTLLTEDKFLNSGADGARTVSQWFSQHPGAEALSQFNGDAIFIRKDMWEPFFMLSGPFYDNGNPSSYAMGTLMHEILHKGAVGGGFNHSQMEAALNSIGAYSRPVSQNGISASLASICFK